MFFMQLYYNKTKTRFNAMHSHDKNREGLDAESR